MADILDQSAKKRRLKNEDDSERESNDKRRRYSTRKESSRSISHSNRHKYKRKDDEERRSRHRHRRENTNNSSSHSRTRSESRGIRRKHRRSYSRDKDSFDKFNTLNGRWNGSFYERSPPREYPHLSRRRWYVSPLAGYREKSRSPRQNRYERDEEYYEPYERDDYSAAMRNSRGYPELKREIQDLLHIERHHLAYEGKEDSNGDIQDVEWCYTYLDPAISGHIKGGRAKLHHRCRQCNRICLHLLGVCFTRERMCLACAAKERGWREDEVPSWYFHKASSCRHCSTRQRYYGHY